MSGRIHAAIGLACARGWPAWALLFFLLFALVTLVVAGAAHYGGVLPDLSAVFRRQVGWPRSSGDVEGAPEEAPRTCWGPVEFFLVSATLTASLSSAVAVPADPVVAVQSFVRFLESQAVSVPLTLLLVITGQLVALLMRALKFHRTPGGRCLLLCDTAAVAPVLFGLAASTSVANGPLLWEIRRPSLVRRRGLMLGECRKHAPALDSECSWLLLWRPLPEITRLYLVTSRWESLAPCALAVGDPWSACCTDSSAAVADHGRTCTCCQGFYDQDAFAVGHPASTSAFPTVERQNLSSTLPFGRTF